MNEHGNRSGRSHCLSDFLRDHAGFSDSRNDNFAVATGEHFDCSFDILRRLTACRAFDRFGFDAQKFTDFFKIRFHNS